MAFKGLKQLPGLHRLRIARPALSCVVLGGLVAFATSVNAETGWARQRTGTMAWLHSVFFLDQNHGWAVGSKGTLLETNDAGTSWQIKAAPTPDVLRDVFFIDEQQGWLVVEKNVYDLKTKEEPRSYLMQTVDGGANWKQINIRGIEVDARLVRAVFSRGGRGWAFGEGGAIFTSRDAGATWTRLQSPTRHLLLGGIFIDDDRGWLVGAGATIIQTSDGGDTWHVSQLPQATVDSVRFASTSFVNNRIGWAVGSGGAIYRTTNGGRTWQQLSSGIDADLFDVKFIDAAEGWAVGADGTIIHTVDGGLHWTTQTSSTPHSLERIFFTDRTHGWAVGFGGTIVKYVPVEAPKLSR